MKTRILSGAVGLSVIIIILFYYYTMVLNAAMAAVIVMAVYELLLATKYTSNSRVLAFTALAFSAAVPFFRTPYFNLASKTACFAFVAVLFLIMLVKNGKIRLEQMGLVFLIATVIPFGFSSVLYIQDIFGRNGSLFFIVLIFVTSWSADIGAYFIGTFFGKHKLIPSISPKKTVEGAIGGVVFCVGVSLLWGYIYSSRYQNVQIHYVWLAIVSLVLSVISMFGDLSASLIKRTCNIKDFGTIIPGHGGVLDRFDSVLFVAPALYLVVSTFPAAIAQFT